jgi:hypothetical protein
MTSPAPNLELAEFHDIGKIIDWHAVGLRARGADGRWKERDPHEFEKCNDPEWAIDFASPVWEAMLRKDNPKYPNTAKMRDLRLKHFRGSAQWAVISFADEFASGLGRLRESAFQGDEHWAYYCLWTGETADNPRLAQKDDLYALIDFLNRNPSWQQTKERYRSTLHARAESAMPGLNVVTLYSHSVMTGQIARVLQPLAQHIDSDAHFPDAERAVADQKLTALDILVQFPQQPFRTADLAIFSARRSTLKAIASRYPDNVLLHYANRLIALFCSEDEANLFRNSFLGAGLLIAERKAIKRIGYWLSPKNGLTEELHRTAVIVHHPALPDSLDPPLCESCQLARGVRRWPADNLVDRPALSAAARHLLNCEVWNTLRPDNFSPSDLDHLGEWLNVAEERLCPRCFDLRSSAPSLTKLAQWDSGKVMWARITLDIDSLTTALLALHKQYTARYAEQSPDLEQFPVRFPLLRDFTVDYEGMLSRWTGQITAVFGPDLVEFIDDGFVCIKLTGNRSALEILRTYHAAMTHFFPRLLDLEIAPVRFAVSIAPAKHPFFASWRLLENPADSIALYVIDSGRAIIRLSRLGSILKLLDNAARDRRTYHRLRDIARTSQKLAELILADKTHRDHGLETLRKIQPLGLDFQSLVTLADLVETGS